MGNFGAPASPMTDVEYSRDPDIHGPWSYLAAPTIGNGLWPKLIDHDRSHSRPPHPDGHNACRQPGCEGYDRGYYNGSDWSDQIREGRWYLCNVSGEWFMGKFSEYKGRWIFDGWHTTLPLSAIWLVYEIEGLPTGPEIEPYTPPRNLVKLCTNRRCYYYDDYPHPEWDH